MFVTVSFFLSIEKAFFLILKMSKNALKCIFYRFNFIEQPLYLLTLARIRLLSFWNASAEQT